MPKRRVHEPLKRSLLPFGRRSRGIISRLRELACPPTTAVTRVRPIVYDGIRRVSRRRFSSRVFGRFPSRTRLLTNLLLSVRKYYFLRTANANRIDRVQRNNERPRIYYIHTESACVKTTGAYERRPTTFSTRAHVCTLPYLYRTASSHYCILF